MLMIVGCFVSYQELEFGKEKIFRLRNYLLLSRWWRIASRRDPSDFIVDPITVARFDELNAHFLHYHLRHQLDLD